MEQTISLFKRFNRRLDRLDFWLFELSVWFHVIARTLVAVFVPVILIRAGFDIKEIIIFYVIFHALDIPLNFIAPPLVRRYGARIIFALSSMFAIAYFSLLSFIVPGEWVVLIILALFAALYDVLYWSSQLILFIKSNQLDKQTDRNTGILFAVKNIAMMIAPAIGAFILIVFGSTALLVTSAVVFIISLIPLLRVDDFSDRPLSLIWKIRKFFAPRNERRNYLSVVLFGMHRAVEFIIWPLFLYVSLGSIESVAMVPVIVAITAIAFALFLNRRKIYMREGIIAFGSIALASLWLLRILIQTEFFIYMSIFLSGFFILLISIPLNASVFDRAEVTDPLSAVMYRNIASMIGHFLVFAFLLLAVDVFRMSFIFASCALLLLALFNVFIVIQNNRDEESMVRMDPHYSLEEH